MARGKDRKSIKDVVLVRSCLPLHLSDLLERFGDG
jgi:hypothetical protein